MTVSENYNAILTFLKDNSADAELVAFVEGRIAQENKARESAKAKRLEKNGGEKKNAADSEFYTNLRNAIYKVLTTDFKTGDALISEANVVTPNGKKVLAAQVAMALKPMITDGTVVVGDIIVDFTDKNGLKKQVIRKAYKLA